PCRGLLRHRPACPGGTMFADQKGPKRAYVSRCSGGQTPSHPDKPGGDEEERLERCPLVAKHAPTRTSRAVGKNHPPTTAYREHAWNCRSRTSTACCCAASCCHWTRPAPCTSAGRRRPGRATPTSPCSASGW